MSTNIEELVNIYLTIRNQRESILREYEAKDAELKKDLQAVEQSLLAVCNETNTDGFNDHDVKACCFSNQHRFTGFLSHTA